MIEDKKWENLPSSFKEVKVDKMDGKNLLGKVSNPEEFHGKAWKEIIKILFNYFL